MKRLDLVSKVEEEARILRSVIEKATKLETGKMDVILSPELSGIAAHESVGHPQEADRILGREGAQAGESYLKKDSLGYKIGSSEANVSDDPNLVHSNGYCPVDDEGVRAAEEAAHSGWRDHRVPPEQEHLGRARGQEQRVGQVGRLQQGADHQDVEHVRRARRPHGRGAHQGGEARDILQVIHRMEHRRQEAQPAVRRPRGVQDQERELGTLVKAPVLEITTPALWGSVRARAGPFESATCGKGGPDAGHPCLDGRTRHPARRREDRDEVRG